MIAGIGTDIVSIARIRDTLDRHGASFAQRILSDDEFVALNNVKEAVAAAWLAKRWAAKEAFAKAAGTGMFAPLTFAGIGVTHDTQGKPQFALSNTVQQWLSERGVTQTHLSISDEREHAIAFVIFEKS
jgi:holo-[acyl-carrier protein] synthase